MYWLLPAGKSRNVLLLVASYFFYMSWMPEYGLLLFAMTAANYLLALGIFHFRKVSKPLFVLGITINLLALGYFKYASFVLSTVLSFCHWSHIQLDLPPQVEVILPLAISFFVFEFIHYLSDVYKGDKPLKDPVEFGLFAAFFPSQIAGPIKRYQDFVAKIRDPLPLSGETLNEGLGLLLQGLFKKLALANNFAIIANAGFEKYSTLGTLETYIAVLAFTFQIYFDFSGYTDMGRGSALLLGIRLPVNFNVPYLASNLIDFWKRWHISLSLWLRDYVYIPLGGKRCSPLRKNFNLLATMLIGGLWHGASWHFVLWGAVHGIGLTISHMYADLVSKTAILQTFHKSTLSRIICVALTFFFVVMTWVLFRAETTNQALSMIGQMLSFGLGNNYANGSLDFYLQSSLLPYSLTLYLIYIALFSPYVIPSTFPLITLKNLIFSRQPVKVACYLGVFLASIGLSSGWNTSFIYFQF